MTPRERFLAACACRNQGRPPVWIMRQAGRYLPEYRALKEKHSFVEMVRIPELAAEVTMQPLRRFALDAAITFSDILVVPEAMGQPYMFSEGGGIRMEFALEGAQAVGRLQTEGTVERLGYVAEAQRRIRGALGEDKALLGFCGSPWTLAVYMVEGGSPGAGQKICAWAREDRPEWRRLMEKLVVVLAGYLQSQIAAGTDVVQIFDSWAGLCPEECYKEWSLRWITDLCHRLPDGFPVIVYARGMGSRSPLLAATGAAVLGIDHETDLAAVRAAVGAYPALQGNLAPEMMSGPAEDAAAATRVVLESMRGDPGYIFNLGHGILPTARIETVAAVVDAVVHS